MHLFRNGLERKGKQKRKTMRQEPEAKEEIIYKSVRSRECLLFLVNK